MLQPIGQNSNQQALIVGRSQQLINNQLFSGANNAGGYRNLNKRNKNPVLASSNNAVSNANEQNKMYLHSQAYSQDRVHPQGYGGGASSGNNQL